MINLNVPYVVWTEKGFSGLASIVGGVMTLPREDPDLKNFENKMSLNEARKAYKEGRPLNKGLYGDRHEEGRS